MVTGILLKKLLRDFKSQKGQLTAIMVIVIIGVMFYTGINATFRNLTGASEKYYREYRFADIWVSVYRAPEALLGRVYSLPYVRMAAGRVVQDVKLEISGEDAALRIITLPDERQDTVNDVIVKSGRYFSEGSGNECLVEEEFFKAHRLKEGDYISPIINGVKTRLKVIGSVKSPEYVYQLKDGSDLIPDNRKFGVAYVKKSFGQAIFGFNGAINDVSLILKEGSDITEVKEDLKKLFDQYGVVSIVEREDQLSNRMLSEEIRGLKSSGSSFPIVFFTVASIIIYIMMGRMVENQRMQIGVLKALGYRNSQVLVHYMSYSAIIGAAGSVVGSVLGMLLGKSLTELENMYYHLPPADMKIYPDLALPASLLTLFFCLAAGYASCRSVLGIMPSEAMRPKAPKAGYRIMLEKVTVVWNRLDSSWRMISRNLFRYKRRAALTSIGILFSAALLVIGFGVNDTVDHMIEQQYSTIQNYDIKVTFTKFINKEELGFIKSLKHVSKLEPLVETGMEISNGWRKKTVALTAMAEDAELHRIVDKKGNTVKLPSDGIMIPEKLARTLEVKELDKVFLDPLYPGKEKKKAAVKGTIQQYIGLSAYCSMDSARYILGEGECANSAVLKLTNAAYEKEVIDKLKEIPVVGSIQSKSDSLQNLIRNMAAINAMMGVMTLLAGILAVAVVYNIATINIFERQRELATMKVLGFKDREIHRVIFGENLIITVLGILLGIPFGRWVGNYILNAFETDAYTFSFVASMRTYVVAAIMTLAFTFLTNLILMRKIKSIDMVQILKSNE